MGLSISQMARMSQLLDEALPLDEAGRRAWLERLAHIRVTAELIDALDGTHRWSETYDRDIGDVLKVQSEVATNLVRSLQLEVTNPLALSPRASPLNNEAYDLYLSRATRQGAI